MRRKIWSIALTGWLVLGCQAQEVTHWRGPDGCGVYPDRDLLKVWPAEGPEILWTYDELGQGYSSPAITESGVYITGMVGRTGYLFHLDLDGRLLYKIPYGPEFSDSYYGSRSSATVAGDQVYVMSGYGKLVCFAKQDGKMIWSRDLVKDLGGYVIQWGINETPVVYGEYIYATPGGRKNNVVALNRFTGGLIWSCPGKGERSAYCTPLLFNHQGRSILTTHTESHLLGIDARTGKLLWTQHQPNQWSVHANTPIYKNGGLFYFSGYGQGGAKLVLSADGTSVNKPWTSKQLDSRIGGAVLLNGYLYGSGDYNREWMCIDWQTGDVLWTSGELTKGTVIAADGLLICYTERGELALVKANHEKFELLSKTRVTRGSGQHWAHPVLFNGKLFLRHGNSLIAYRIK